MQQSKIGNGSVAIPRIGLGCVTFGREIDEEQSFRVLDDAFARGINLLDTAEGYGGGQIVAYRKQIGLEEGLSASAEMHSSEKIIGRWLRRTGLRDQVVIQTKVARNFTPEHVREALDASLDRLGTDRVDIYLMHSYDPHTPLEVAMEAMSHARSSGKARLIGCSNFSIDQLRQAQSLAPLHMIQPVYNLVRREIEREVLPFCRQHGIAAVTYSPLGAGFLSGKYRQGAEAPAGARFDLVPGHDAEYFSERNFAIVEKLRAFAERTGVPMVRLAMSWALQREAIDGVLIGARHAGHLDNAVEALNTPLSPELMAEMDSWAG
jgi:aryl-alcohol dehydrogenase-like predicted oxidoreductase